MPRHLCLVSLDIKPLVTLGYNSLGQVRDSQPHGAYQLVAPQED